MAIFGKNSRTPSAEPAPVPHPTAVPPASESSSDVKALLEQRAAAQAGIDELVPKRAAFDREIGDLRQKHRRALLEKANASDEGSLRHHEATAFRLGQELADRLVEAAKINEEIDGYVSEIDSIEKQIKRAQCEPVVKRLEVTVRAMVDLLLKFVPLNVSAHSDVALLRANGWPGVADVFLRGVSLNNLWPTELSKFYEACSIMGFEIARLDYDASIPFPEEHFGRMHDDEAYTRYAATCGMRGGYEIGRARAAALAHRSL